MPVNLCFNQSSFLLYWQKVRFYIRFFPVNKDCNRDMARFPPVFDTNPPATAWFRESNVKPGMFILSYVKRSSVAHVLVPNKNRKFIRQPLEEAVEIAADVIAASECYIHPVPPPPPSQDTSSGSETADSGGSGHANQKPDQRDKKSNTAKKKGNKSGPSGAEGKGGRRNGTSTCERSSFTPPLGFELTETGKFTLY